jgi:Outer membrane lipoprotein-sorting protein
MSRFRVPFLLALLVAHAGPASAQTARQIMIEVQNRTRSRSEHYEGSLQVFNAKQKISRKRWEYDRLGVYGNSKSELHFTAPPEVRGVALLVINHPDRSSDQWMWVPAEERDRRIAIQDRATRFFGTDFSFEDLEERDVDQYDYSSSGDELIDGVACWKIQSRPKESKISQYTSAVLWVRKDRYFLVRTDNFNKDRLVRQITYSDVQSIQGIWTARTVVAVDHLRNSWTVLSLDRVQYDLPTKSTDFTRESLRR